jgi:hypothetical protein
MAPLDAVIRDIQQECTAEFRARLRARLLQQPREWLVDQLMARMDMDRTIDAATAAIMQTDAAIEGVVDEPGLRAFVARYRELTRDRLEADGYLSAPPVQGSTVIAEACRTTKGDALLRQAKQLLDAVLFGDADDGVRLARVQRELLTITVARAKAEPIACLLRAATEIDAEGTWRDPERVSHDERAPNTLFQVEYGEVATELVGRAIVVCLRLINDLEINEQILYARMENIEESSLEPVS